MSKPIRPILSYFGSKNYLSAKLLSFIPPHKTFIDPFCGSASMLFRKPPSAVEIINDLNDNVYDLFRIVRDPDLCSRLCDLIEQTPYSRTEYLRSRSYRTTDDVLERVRSFLVVSNMGWGGRQRYQSGWKTGYRDFRTTTVWNSLPERLTRACIRLKLVQIEHCDGTELITRSDRTDSFFFIDPPYPYYSLNVPKHCYDVTMTNDEHEKLVDVLSTLKGRSMIVIYDNSIYQRLLAYNYTSENILARDMHRAQKSETVYMNYSFTDFFKTPKFIEEQ